MRLGYLVIYTIIICTITLKSYITKNNILYRALWTEYAVSAIFCVFACLNRRIVGYGTMHNRWYDLSDTTLWGYLLLIVCNVIAFKPFKIFDENRKLENYGKTEKKQNFFIIYSIIYIITALIFIIFALGFIKSAITVSNFGDLRQNLFDNGENEAVGRVSLNFVANICFKLCLEFKLASVFIVFAMIKEKVKPVLATLLLITTFFVYYVSCSSMAARGGMLIFSFCACTIGLIFYKYLSKINRKKVAIAALVFGGIVVSFFFTVSMSRLANAVSDVNPLLRNTVFYLGHGPIEFSKITGSLHDFAYGRTIIGRLFSNFFGTNYSWDIIASDIGFPNIGPVFVTYLGFIYTDFGAFGCIAFTSIWSYITYTLIKKRPYNFSTIYYLLYYLFFYVTGNFTIGRLEYASLVTTTIIYFIIKTIEVYPPFKRIFTARIRVGK